MRPIALAWVVCMVVACSAAARGSSTSALVAYARQSGDGYYRIAVVVPTAPFPSRRLSLGKDAGGPRWSTDGRRLVYTRPSGTYTATLVGAGRPLPVLRPPERIAPSSESVDWAPDGTAIALTREVARRFCTDLFTMRLDGRAIRRLTTSAACESHPAWSPDGRAVAFERQLGETTEIVVADVVRSATRRLGQGTHPAWSPSGRELAFLVRGGIAIVDPASGTALRLLEPEPPYDVPENGLTWSPDGARFAFGFLDLTETKPFTHLAVVESDASSATRLTFGSAFPEVDPDWQPVCTVYGTDGDDVLVGTDGDDLICGLRGDDRIRGGGGGDMLLGGDGDDALVGGRGADRLFGAFGADRLYARDDEPDVVDGGPGADRAWLDQAGDRIADVERIDRT